MDASSPAANPARKTYRIAGMHCAGCVGSVERSLNAVDGVEASVSLPAESATLTLARDVPFEELAAAVEGAGYEIEPIADVDRGEAERSRLAEAEARSREARKTMWAAWALTAPADGLFHSGEDLVLRFLANGTGVQHHDFRRLRLRRPATERRKRRRHLLRVVDVHLATPGFDPKPEGPPGNWGAGGIPGDRTALRQRRTGCEDRHSAPRRLRREPCGFAAGGVGIRPGEQLGRVPSSAVGDLRAGEHTGDFLDPGVLNEGRDPNRIAGF